MINEEDMVEFRFGVDRQRWQQFSKACNEKAERTLSPDEVERRAFDVWCDALDAIVEHDKTKESNGPVVLTIWAK